MKLKSILIAGFLLMASNLANAGQITIQDIAGRDVIVDVPVKSMILGEGRYLPTLAILDRADPTARVAAMMGEFQKYDPATYSQYLKAFPAIADIPTLGRGTVDSFSSEAAITALPDVAIFGLGSGHGPGARHKEIIDRLDAAGIPVVVLDFRIDPLVNTPKSISLLGQLMGREKEAAEFLQFYTAALEVVRKGVYDANKKPSVFMELRVGFSDQCCVSAGQEMLGRFISWAGGNNIMAKKIPGTHGNANLEYLLVHQPDIYVSTAIGNYGLTRVDSKRVILGAGAPEEVAQQTLRNSLERPGMKELKAVQNRKVFSIWHHFYNTPMNVVAVQKLAKWFHPERFKDLNPEQTLAEYFARFQPVELDGVYWTALTQ